jgi:hypothetical protein
VKRKARRPVKKRMKPRVRASKKKLIRDWPKLKGDTVIPVILHISSKQHAALRSIKKKIGVPMQFIASRAIESYLATPSVKKLLEIKRRGLP